MQLIRIFRDRMTRRPTFRPTEKRLGVVASLSGGNLDTPLDYYYCGHFGDDRPLSAEAVLLSARSGYFQFRMATPAEAATVPDLTPVEPAAPEPAPVPAAAPWEPMPEPEQPQPEPEAKPARRRPSKPKGPKAKAKTGER